MEQCRPAEMDAAPYDNLAEEGFRKNVIAYRCVMQIATASAAVPWLLYDENGGEIDQHPLLDLLCHPNPLQDGVSFLESIYAYLEIAGNAYIEAVTPARRPAPGRALCAAARPHENYSRAHRLAARLPIHRERAGHELGRRSDDGRIATFCT